MTTTTCPGCAPLAAEMDELKAQFKALTQTVGAYLERSGFPLVSTEEARAILSPPEPAPARIYRFPGRPA